MKRTIHIVLSIRDNMQAFFNDNCQRHVLFCKSRPHFSFEKFVHINHNLLWQLITFAFFSLNFLVLHPFPILFPVLFSIHFLLLFSSFSLVFTCAFRHHVLLLEIIASLRWTSAFKISFFSFRRCRVSSSL